MVKNKWVFEKYHVISMIVLTLQPLPTSVRSFSILHRNDFRRDVSRMKKVREHFLHAGQREFDVPPSVHQSRSCSVEESNPWPRYPGSCVSYLSSNTEETGEPILCQQWNRWHLEPLLKNPPKKKKFIVHKVS